MDDPLSLKQLSLSTSPANIVNHGSQITDDGLREPGLPG